MMTSQYPEHDRLAAIEDGIGIGERIDARCTAQTNGQRCIKMVGHVRAHLLEDGTVFEGADVAIYPHIRVTAADLDGVAHQLRGPHPWIPGLTFHTYPGLAEALADFIDGWNCVCNVGVQECPRHPGRLMTQEEKIQYRKQWDEKVVRDGV